MTTIIEEKTTRTPLDERKAYTKPEITHELELETRAGSPLSIPNPFNLPGFDPD